MLPNVAKQGADVRAVRRGLRLHAVGSYLATNVCSSQIRIAGEALPMFTH